MKTVRKKQHTSENKIVDRIKITWQRVKEDEAIRTDSTKLHITVIYYLSWGEVEMSGVIGHLYT